MGGVAKAAGGAVKKVVSAPANVVKNVASGNIGGAAQAAIPLAAPVLGGLGTVAAMSALSGAGSGDSSTGGGGYDAGGRPVQSMMVNPLQAGSKIVDNPAFVQLQQQASIETDPKKKADILAALSKMPQKITMSSYSLGNEYKLAGPQAYIGAMGKKINQEELNAMNKAAAQQASSQAQARSQLSMRGGLRGGAAERLAQGGARNQMMALQDTGKSAMLNRLNLGAQGEQMKTDTEKYNLENMLKAMDATNAFNQNTYTDQMKAWAANKQAQATLDAAPKRKGDSGGIMGGVGKITGK
jgi:hypothetical protein